MRNRFDCHVLTIGGRNVIYVALPRLYALLQVVCLLDKRHAKIDARFLIGFFEDATELGNGYLTALINNEGAQAHEYAEGRDDNEEGDVRPGIDHGFTCGLLIAAGSTSVAAGAAYATSCSVMAA